MVTMAEKENNEKQNSLILIPIPIRKEESSHVFLFRDSHFLIRVITSYFLLVRLNAIVGSAAKEFSAVSSNSIFQGI